MCAIWAIKIVRQREMLNQECAFYRFIITANNSLFYCILNIFAFDWLDGTLKGT